MYPYKTWCNLYFTLPTQQVIILLTSAALYNVHIVLGTCPYKPWLPVWHITYAITWLILCIYCRVYNVIRFIYVSCHVCVLVTSLWEHSSHHTYLQSVHVNAHRYVHICCMLILCTNHHHKGMQGFKYFMLLLRRKILIQEFSSGTLCQNEKKFPISSTNKFLHTVPILFGACIFHFTLL